MNNRPDTHSQQVTPEASPEITTNETSTSQDFKPRRWLRSPAWQALTLLVIFLLGGISGYLLRGYLAQQRAAAQLAEQQALQQEANAILAELARQVNPPKGYALPVSYGDLGPQLIAFGAIDFDRFAQVYDRSGHPLTPDQKEILLEGSRANIILNRDNAHFLLNFFWALGLVNQNPLLTEGPMMQYGGYEQIGNFASTGGWTIGAKLATEIYASAPLLTLTPEQQARLEEVAFAVFRPCCNNPTAFPDCNHGMAMLGMLTLMASNDASTDEMFTAAKYANAFWFPQQNLEVALFFQKAQDTAFAKVDARHVTSKQVASSSGYRQVRQWLGSQGFLPQSTGQGNGCGV
jgi:hypothetical protein